MRSLRKCVKEEVFLKLVVGMIKKE